MKAIVVEQPGRPEVLQRIVGLAETGQYRLNLDRVFRMEEIVEAHHYMDAGHASGKLVVMCT